MIFTLIRDDSAVYVDRVAREVDVSDLPADIHAIQFDTQKNRGWIEYKNGKNNESIDLPFFNSNFQKYLDRWNAAAPPPPPPPPPPRPDTKTPLLQALDTVIASPALDIQAIKMVFQKLRDHLT